MGVWTWLHRLPRERAEGASSSSLDLVWLSTNATSSIDTHRAWHALHVLLTGTTAGGAPPASWVVGNGVDSEEPVLSFEPLISSPDDVAFIASYLQYEVSFDSLLRERYPRLFKGAESLDVYSFEGWGEPERSLDMLECGLLSKVFDRVRDFYVAAASAGEIVVKHRG